MLVLSRKPNEEILIGDNIRLTVVSIQGNQVRLGFTAPADVPIFRSELLEPTGAACGSEVSKNPVGSEVSNFARRPGVRC